MKESIGSTLLMQIFFIFFIVIISFMAFSINYAKTFVIKNGVVSIIEKSKGYDEEKIKNYLKEKEYSNDIEYSKNSYKGTDYYNDKGYYYSVTVYVTFNIPLINNTIKIPVRGNTETIFEVEEKVDEIELSEEE